MQPFCALRISQLTCQAKIVTKLTAAAYTVFDSDSNENIYNFSALHECTCVHIFKYKVRKPFKIQIESFILKSNPKEQYFEILLSVKQMARSYLFKCVHPQACQTFQNGIFDTKTAG